MVRSLFRLGQTSCSIVWRNQRNVEKIPTKEKGQVIDISLLSLPVPRTVLFSNQLLEDLDKIWDLKYWIPDPTKPILPLKDRSKSGTL